jgi:hypothetical protein
MNCKEISKEYFHEIQTYMFEYCPGCGVHAPWVNDCQVEDEGS